MFVSFGMAFQFKVCLYIYIYIYILEVAIES